MSDSEHPDVLAFRELAQLIRALGDEMASWRRRAHEAEARLRELDPDSVGGAVPADDRVSELERDNAELRARLESARRRAEQLLERMRFLRQQHELEAEH